MTATGVDSAARRRPNNAGVLLGEDWIVAAGPEGEPLGSRSRRGLVAFNRSPLARKIIIFNLLALVLLVGGVLVLSPFRDSLADQRMAGLVREAALVAERIGAMAGPDPADRRYGGALERIVLEAGETLYVFDRDERILARHAGGVPPGHRASGEATILTDFLDRVWMSVSALLGAPVMPGHADGVQIGIERLVAGALAGASAGTVASDIGGTTLLAAASPIRHDGQISAVLVMTLIAPDIDDVVRWKREQILQIFVVALLVSISLSILLASTIANPLSDLTAAAEIGREGTSSATPMGRVRIPDLTARPDEIGRLSTAMRGMVGALYERIEANERFAADVAHEIKNPLASLRSAVGSLRLVSKPAHRAKLLDVIEHDVRRLDRLVSDISNASRLESELVKEQEEDFDLTRMLADLTGHLAREARERGIDFITDLPDESLVIHGLEARLAQVFVNLVTNAFSFCEAEDAVRIWARRRRNRVLVVVEDTGPGIPDQALGKIFNRFYSDRPASHFGNNSGLGLSISKQIVEAYGGVIWAENIRQSGSDVESAVLGARFVVGLPI